MAASPAAAERTSVYTLKESPYSSHSLLLAALPQAGAGRTVLDVGCGEGYLGQILNGRGYRVTGLERPDGHSKDFPPEVRLIEADLENGLPPLETQYDYVVCADILEHLRRPDEFLKQLRSVLKTGGKLIASLPNSGNLYFRLTVLAGRFPQDEKGLFDRTHLRFYTWDGWRKLLLASGYRVESVSGTGIPVGLAFPAWETSPAVRAAERVCYELARWRKQLFAYQFVVVATHD